MITVIPLTYSDLHTENTVHTQDQHNKGTATRLVSSYLCFYLNICLHQVKICELTVQVCQLAVQG
jgi:hypothetical protein